MSTEIPPILATIRQVIHAANEADRAFDDEIEEDIEAEGKTLLEENIYDVSQLREHLLDASKGVTTKTNKEYRRLMKQCVQFLQKNKLIQADDKFFTKTPMCRRTLTKTAMRWMNTDASALGGTVLVGIVQQ
ncbi:hypothetical protein R3P38DRAFT_3229937 [Favolaschia claudopus]|uniref:Uncharacterized protein n=1 Tax=Favolaschia claudopus TaxID=2862362 RepID=A0AAV9ZMV0_9AGAR